MICSTCGANNIGSTYCPFCQPDKLKSAQDEVDKVCQSVGTIERKKGHSKMIVENGVIKTIDPNPEHKPDAIKAALAQRNVYHNQVWNEAIEAAMNVAGDDSLIFDAIRRLKKLNVEL